MGEIMCDKIIKMKDLAKKANDTEQLSESAKRIRDLTFQRIHESETSRKDKCGETNRSRKKGR